MKKPKPLKPPKPVKPPQPAIEQKPIELSPLEIIHRRFEAACLLMPRQKPKVTSDHQRLEHIDYVEKTLDITIL